MWFANAPWLFTPALPPVTVVVKKMIAPTYPLPLQKIVDVPRIYRRSEIKALRFVSAKLGYKFSASGPDYALYDTPVSFGLPVMAGKFLAEIGSLAFLPSEIRVNIQNRSITVKNLGPLQGPLPARVRYQVIQKSQRSWTFKAE